MRALSSDEKDRMFDTLDAIQSDVRKLREGRIRDLNRVAGINRRLKVIEARAGLRATRWHEYLKNFVFGFGGALMGFIAVHPPTHLP